MKVNLHKFIQITFLLSLLLIPNIGYAQRDKAQKINDTLIQTEKDIFPASVATVYIDEDFSSADGVTPPQGWTQNIITGEQGIDLWRFGTPSGIPNINPPLSVPVAVFNCFEYSNNSQPENVALESPVFNAAAGTDVILEIDHYFNHLAISEIFIEVWDGSTWRTVLNSSQTTLNPQHEIIDITSEAAGVVDSKVRFRWTGDDALFWIIDNIKVYSADPPPAGAVPVSPPDGAVDVDINSGLNWEAGSGAVPTGYRIYFGTDGNGITPPTNIEENTDLQLVTTYTPSSPLLYNTTYYWMIIPYNESGDASGVPIWSFTVMEDPPVTVYPYLEDFEGSFPPLYYIRYTGLLLDPISINSTNTGWEQADWRNSVSSSGKAAKLNISGTTVNHWLTTTLADLGNDVDYQLEFDVSLNASGTSDPPEQGGTDDRFVVIISTDSGATWSASNILREWNNSGSQYVYDEISSLGEHIVLDLSGYSGMIQLGFYGESTVSNANNDLMIDNLEIKKFSMPPIFLINPAELDFGSVGVGNSRTLQAEISNTGDEDLVISSIVSANEEFTFSPAVFPISISPGNSQTLDITFSPTETGSLTSSLTIAHNAQGSPLAYSLSGTGSDDGPAFNVSPVSLNFGLVGVDDSKSMSITVNNLGLVNELQITEALISDSGFTVSPTSANIPAGGNQVFTVTFSPTSAETYSGSIIFTSNDPASPHTIPVTGKGSGESGLIFQEDTVYQLEDDVYTTVVQLKGLDPLGEKVHAIQFRLAVNKSADDNTILTFRNIKKGLDASDENWVLDYNLFRGPITANGASVDSVYVLLYNLEQNGGFDPLVDYNNLFTIEYKIANLPALNDTLKSSLIISNASATTNSGYPVDINSVDSIMTIKAVNRVSSRGDVNGDGYIDILDLIMVVDHIIGKDSLTGEFFKRADISPWIQGTDEPEPDGIVNVQDLSLIQNIVLTGFYPDNKPIRKVSGTLPKIAGDFDAKLKAYITDEGITLYVDSKSGIRGAQVEFFNVNNLTEGLKINTELGQGYFVKLDSALRAVMYDRLGAGMIEQGEHFLADIPFHISNPGNVIPGKIILVDANRHRLDNIEIEIINDDDPDLPLEFLLYQNYPNPFNPATDIKFQIPASCYATLKIYNMIGEEVRTLFAGNVMRGTYTINWNGLNDNGSRVSSGLYIYRLTAEGEGLNTFIKVRKMVLLK